MGVDGGLISELRVSFDTMAARILCPILALVKDKFDAEMEPGKPSQVREAGALDPCGRSNGESGEWPKYRE